MSPAQSRSLNGSNVSGDEVSIRDNSKDYQYYSRLKVLRSRKPEASQTPILQEPHFESLRYDKEPLDVSDSFRYVWQLTDHRFIGDRVSRTYPNGQTPLGSVQKYLSSDGPNEALLHIMAMVMRKMWMLMNVLLQWNNIVDLNSTLSLLFETKMNITLRVSNITSHE